MDAETEFIRQAIASGQYHKALLQWNAYARQLRQAIQTGSLSAAQMEELSNLHYWSRTMLLSARSHLAQRLHELEVAAAYHVRRAAKPGSLRACL